ncbi:MAG: InlB B-repeat-containing protein, partial [Clostridia bacterium]|nr:InlB B-repeat-containing protein [Clostridia bacterium]
VHYHQMGSGANTIRGVYEYMYPYIEAGRLWTATFADAAQYGQERDTATLTMLETGANVIRFTLTDQMNDILFYHPLSVRVKVDSTWTGARAYQNGEEVKVQLITKDGETYLMVDAVPDKGEVTVVRTEMTVMEQSENAIRFEAVDGLTATQAMTAQFPVAWNYAYATQRGVQIPAYVKDGVLYVTFDVNGGQVSIVPLTSQYDSLDSYTMTMVYSGYVAPDPAKSITIANAGELVMFSEYVNAGNSLAGITIELIADIDMTGVEYQGAGFNFTYKGSSGSYMVRPFSGVFEGNKHKIYNVNINQLTIDAGIFGYIKDAIVRNLSVEGNVNGGERVGGIVSYADNSLISQCSFTGNVTASVIHKNQATGRTIGGIVGMVRNGSVIEHCHFKGDVMSIPCESYDVEVYNIGGIVGSFGAGTVNNCSVYGNVIAGDNSKHVGGIVGTIEGAGEGGLRRVSNCFASVNVKGAQYVGGIIGYLSSSSSNRTANIYNCSVIGSVTANDYVGGLGGYGSGLSGTHITNCYSAVKVNAPADAVYVGTILGGFQAESYGLKIDKNYYVGSLNPDMPVSVKISGNGSFSSIDVADGAAALEALNTKANATANYNAWRLVDGIPSACYEEICTVTFVDKNGDVLAFVSLPKGFAATAPNAPLFEGFAFTGWDKAFDNVTSDMTVTALYKEVSIFTVTFIGKDGIVLKTEKVNEGLAATAPTLPVIEGWRFDGWDKTFDVVNDHLMVTAKYVKTWTLTYLDQDGEVWNVEVYDEGTVPTLAIAPAVKGATFISWNPASVGAVTEDVVLTPIYQVRSATSAADYTVMHWTLGGNVIYTGNYRDNIKNAVEAADPDIVILTGMDSHTLKNPKTIFSFSEGYTCWAYGAGSSNSPAAATEAVHRYVGSGVAIYYKTDLFTPAGEVGHGFPGGDRVSQFTIFPLANNEGLVIPVVVSYMLSTATEAQRQTWVSQLKEALGEGFDTAIIRLYVEGSTSPDASWSASFNQAADENGYSLVCDGGTNVKKTQGTHNSTSTHYVFMMTYGTGEPTASLSNHTSVQITEDSTTYPNNHSTHTAFYDVAYTITFSVGATGSEE